MLLEHVLIITVNHELNCTNLTIATISAKFFSLSRDQQLNAMKLT